MSNSKCVISSEYFMITSLYLVRLKIFQWIKFLQRDQGSIKKKRRRECRDESEIYNYKRIQLLNNILINVILGLEGYGWPGLTVRDGYIDGFFISGQFDFWGGVGGGGMGYLVCVLRIFFPKPLVIELKHTQKIKLKTFFRLRYYLQKCKSQTAM